MATDKPRFSLTLSEDVLARIESYQSEKGFATRSKAMLELVQMGIKALDQLYVQLDAAPKISEQAQELLPLFEQLDLFDKGRIIGQTAGLLMQEKYQL